MNQKAFNEHIAMSLLQQCAWVWEHCTKNEKEGEFSLYDVTMGMTRNAHDSKTGTLEVQEEKCDCWDVFNKTKSIDGLEFDAESYMSRMTFRKDDGYDFIFSFPIALVFDVTRKFCITNACQALMGKAVFGYTDGERWSHLPGSDKQAPRKPKTGKKFWCHYIGRDGNTPKRRQMELKPISELVPAVQGGTTPLWYYEDAGDGTSRNFTYYRLLAQLSDTVAVTADWLTDRNLEEMNQTDADIAERANKFYNYTQASGADRERLKRKNAEWVESAKEIRDRQLNLLRRLASYDELLLQGGVWITSTAIKAFTEVMSPYLPVLQVMRDEALAEREAEEQRRRMEEAQKRQEEERKRKEDEAKERQRVIAEGDKFRNGEKISGSDVVELCRICGINIHLRTVHNLQQVIVDINGHRECRYYRQPKGKRKPQLDGCYDTAEKLYLHLQNHYEEIAKAA